MSAIASNRIGPDGKVAVWCKTRKTVFRVFPIDAIEQVNAGVSLVDPPKFEVRAPDGTKRIIDGNQAQAFIAKGWEVVREDVVEDEVPQAPVKPNTTTSTDTAEKTADELKAERLTFFMQYSHKELVKLCAEAGVNLTGANIAKSKMAELLRDVANFTPSFQPTVV